MCVLLCVVKGEIEELVRPTKVGLSEEKRHAESRMIVYSASVLHNDRCQRTLHLYSLVLPHSLSFLHSLTSVFFHLSLSFSYPTGLLPL